MKQIIEVRKVNITHKQFCAHEEFVIYGKRFKMDALVAKTADGVKANKCIVMHNGNDWKYYANLEPYKGREEEVMYYFDPMEVDVKVMFQFIK